MSLLKFIFFVSLSVYLTSCDNDNDQDVSKEEIPISLEGVALRLISDGTGSFTEEGSDRGLYVFTDKLNYSIEDFGDLNEVGTYTAVETFNEENGEFRISLDGKFTFLTLTFQGPNSGTFTLNYYRDDDEEFYDEYIFGNFTRER